MNNCIKCGCRLLSDDIGAHRKFIERKADKFMCVKCLADEIHTTEEELREKIKHFKRLGCSLF